MHLHSHVFRGLKGSPVPAYFQENAAAAVAAATATIEMLLTDYDIREGLVGIPHYLHSMIAFACVFLLKVAAQHSGQFIQDAVVYDLTTKAVEQFRSTAVGKLHLVHLMADGLEKMTASKIGARPNGINRSASNGATQNGFSYAQEASSTLPSINNGLFDADSMGAVFGDDFSFGTSSFLHFNPGDSELSFSGFGL